MADEASKNFIDAVIKYVELHEKGYKLQVEMLKSIDLKAQINAAIAGVFVAAVIGKIDVMRNACVVPKYLAAVGVLILTGSIILSSLTMFARKGRKAFSLVDIASRMFEHSRDESTDNGATELFLKLVQDHAEASAAEISVITKSKSQYLWIGQIGLFVGITIISISLVLLLVYS